MGGLCPRPPHTPLPGGTCSSQGPEHHDGDQHHSAGIRTSHLRSRMCHPHQWDTPKPEPHGGEVTCQGGQRQGTAGEGRGGACSAGSEAAIRQGLGYIQDRDWGSYRAGDEVFIGEGLGYLQGRRYGSYREGSGVHKGQGLWGTYRGRSGTVRQELGQL